MYHQNSLWWIVIQTTSPSLFVAKNVQCNWALYHDWQSFHHKAKKNIHNDAFPKNKRAKTYRTQRSWKFSKKDVWSATSASGGPELLVRQEDSIRYSTPRYEGSRRLQVFLCQNMHQTKEKKRLASHFPECCLHIISFNLSTFPRMCVCSHFTNEKLQKAQELFWARTQFCISQEDKIFTDFTIIIS